jgi:hypothetical protein
MVAALFAMGFVGNCSVRVLCLFLQLSTLDRFVAPSFGAQQASMAEMEEKINDFGDMERDRLSQGMPAKKISVGEDETFHPQVCLVAIEPVSNYILLEQYEKTRDAKTWDAAMQAATAGLPVEVIQSTSDEARGLVKHVKEGLGAHHSPDLFHVQHELSKATSVALSAQLRRCEKRVEDACGQTAQQREDKAEYEERKAQGSVRGRPPDFAKRIEQAKEQEQVAGQEAKEARERKEAVSEAIREISSVYHPFDLETGGLQDSETLWRKLTVLLDKIEQIATAASLRQKCLERIAKARRVLPQMIATIAFVHMILREKVEVLSLPCALESIVYDHSLPGLYMERMAAQARDPEQRRVLRHRAELLLAPIRERDGPLKQLDPEDWACVEGVARECATLFQRSSSCVEGRNGQLSLRHQSLHRIRPKKLRALTVVHNFFIMRADGSTAAERFFEQKAEDLFSYLLKEMGLPRRSARSRSRFQVTLGNH